eukprot:scaffold14282_cov99-Isochrysis_galbana.AAC.4
MFGWVDRARRLRGRWQVAGHRQRKHCLPCARLGSYVREVEEARAVGGGCFRHTTCTQYVEHERGLGLRLCCVRSASGIK